MAGEDSYIDRLIEQSKSPAAPKGLQQTATAGAQSRAGEGPYAESYIGSLVGSDPATSMARDAAQSWYTGANMEGTSNGWDTGFYNAAITQEREQLELANTSQDTTKYFEWFDRSDATGVASWDDERRGIRYGDVYENGKKVGNLYDQFDRHTANVMMAEMKLDADTKQKIYSDPDRERWLDDEISKIVEQDTALLLSSVEREGFEGEIDERQQSLLEGHGDTALTAAGGLGAGGLGAAIGTAIAPGLGTAIGFGVGSGIGALAAWANRDQLTEQTARAMEITERAGQRYGDLGQFTTGLKEYSGIGLRMIAPFSNATQGLTDVIAGKGGDGKSEFYAVDADGNREVSKWVQVADVGATLVDSLVQFGSGAGVAAYMGGTAAHVAGSAGSLAVTGEKWSDYEAGFHDVEGAGQWASALGSVGIDVVQLGFAGAIAKAGSASRAAFATDSAAAQATGRFAQAAGRAKERLLPWTVAAEGQSFKTINGMKFTVDDATGKAVDARATWTLLAPSEVLRWAPTTWRARMKAADAGVPTYDDFYRAALELGGGSRFSAALVNGYAEGGEEAVQAVLDPLSVGAGIDAGQVVEAAFYGAAAGAGMSLGRISAPATNEQAQKYRAKSLYMMRNNAFDMADEQWDELYSQMTPAERKRAAFATPEEAQQVFDVLQTMQEAHTIDQSRESSIGLLAWNDMRTAALARDLATINPAVDGSLVLMGMSTDHVVSPEGKIERDLFGPNVGVMTAWQAVDNVLRINRGLQVQADELKRDLEAATAELTQAQSDGVAEAIEAAQQKLEAVNARVADTQGLTEVSGQISSRLLQMYEVFRSETDATRVRTLLREINEFLSDAYDGELKDENGQPFDARMQEYARRSVELRMGRHPFIDKGSFILLKPQVSAALTEADAHGTVYTHQSTLKPLGGDHDGDFLVLLNTTYLPQSQLDSLRRGDQYFKTVEGERVELVVDPPDGEKTLVAVASEALASSDNAVFGSAQHELLKLKDELYARYSGIVEDKVLIVALNTFHDQVRSNNPDARMNLATTLFNANLQGMLGAGNRNEAEVPWLMARISRTWDAIQKAYAANAADRLYSPKSVFAPQPADRAFQTNLAMQEAATDGVTMSLLFEGISPVRDAQHLHYSAFRAAVELSGALDSGYVPELASDFIELFAELGSGLTESELARVQGRNATQKRVVLWLEKIAERAKAELGTDASEALLLIANTQVQDVTIVGPNHYEVGEGRISFLQLLLKKSIEIDRANHRAAAEDSDIIRKLNSLERLTRQDAKDKNRSHTAQLAVMEVFGHLPLHRLLGDSSKYLGPQLTLNQLLASLTNVDSETRSNTLYKWRRRAPYVLHAAHGNPPYSAGEIMSEAMTGFKILVDSVAAAANKAPTTRRARDKAAGDALVNGFRWLHSVLQDYRKVHSARLSGDTSDLAVLRDLLRNDRVASSIAAIIPDAAKVGAFQLIDGKVYAAPWVEEMLVEKNAEKAAVSYIVNSKIAEWNALGGNIDERDIDPDTGELRPNSHPRSYGRLKSRFLQTFYHLAQQPDGFEFDRLILTMRSATSPADLMEKINSEPAWLGGRSELYAFYDDVAMFEADPSEVWTANLPGTLQREAIQQFAKRMEIMSQTMADYATQMESEKRLLSSIRAYHEDRTNNRDQASRYHELLAQAIRNRFTYPDTTGRAARDQLTAIIQSGVIRMQDKGKADPAVAPFGEPLVTLDEFGVKLSVFQELDALTSLDPEDIRSNLTKLVEGPVRVGLADGSTVLVDLSTVDGALSALENPVTNGFAKAVLFPVTRDVDNNNVLQMYQDVTHTGLKTMLEEQTFHHLFPKNGQRLTLEQAHRYINTLEAGIRKAALTGTSEEQERAFYPIQQIINEFVVAYIHQPGYERMDSKKVRDELIVDVAQALMQMSALTTNDQLLETKTLIKGVLRARFDRDASALRDMLASGFERATLDVMLTDATAISYQRAAAQIQAQMADPSLTPEQREALQTRLDRLGEQVQEFLDNIEPLRDDDMVQSVINMYTLTGDPLVDLERKKAIFQALGAQNRIGKFQGNYLLIDKVLELMSQDPMLMLDSSAITDEEWKELGAWAATVYISKRAGRSASSVTTPSIILGKEGEQQRRFFDATWGYLIDGFLNEQVLQVARNLAASAGYRHDFTPDQVANTLEHGLFNKKKFGPWTDRVVYESMKARQVLSSASVGLAVPVAGDSPKDVADYVAAGWNLTKLPSAKLLTTDAVFKLAEDGTLDVTDPSTFIKLNNHFASRVVLRGLTVNGNVEVDLMPEVGQAWLGDDSVRDSGYKVISVLRLNAAIDKALENTDFVGDPEVVIDYFDVDSKPFTREWANNVYFDGVGRGGPTSTGPGPVAELVFAPGALSKTGQQNPLDMATKGGKGYKPTPISPYSTVVNLEATSPLVSEILVAKTRHMLGKEYDTGFLLEGDSTAIYKLMKQRHVVVGWDAEGNKHVHWAEEVISWQAANDGAPFAGFEIPLSDVRLVALSDSQAQTLHGRAGTKGLPGVMTRPMFNIMDADPFPSLSAERLAELKLTRLGELGTLEDSPFATMLPLPQARWSEDRGKDAVSRHRMVIERFRGEQIVVRADRSQIVGQAEGQYNISKINEEGAALLQRLLSKESLAPLFARLKIPFTETTDLNELQISDVLRQQLVKLAEVSPSSVIWQHRHNSSSDPAHGVLGAVAVREDFRNIGKIPPPTFEDIVVIDMDEIMVSAGGVLEQAYDQAKAVIRAYARRGVTLAFVAENAVVLRNAIAEHLNQGGEGYSPMAESKHFFAPINEDFRVNQNQRALDSTLVQVQQMTADAVVLRHLSDRYGTGSSENATYLDLRPDTRRWEGVSLTLLPTNLMGTAQRYRFAYGVPVAGLGPLDQRGRVRDALLPLLRTKEGRKHLRRLAGGDPKDVPIYRENENGTIDPGVRSIDDAFDVLQSTLESGAYPLENERTLMMGDLVPVLGADNSILLIRVGFKLPSVFELDEQLKTPIVSGEPETRVGIGTNELQSSWTVRPPFTITRIDSDPLVGLAVEGRYDLSPYGKGVLESDGFKSGYSPMPNDLAAPDIPMAANGLRVTEFGSRKAAESKVATTGYVKNFRWLFALSGIDFKADMVDYFLGERQRSEEEFKNDWATVGAFLARWAANKQGYTATEIAEMLDTDTFFATTMTELNALGREFFGDGFVAKGSQDPLLPQVPAKERLAQVILATLQAPGIKLNHVIETPGLLTLNALDDGVSQVTLMPQLLTDSLKDVNHKELHDMLIDRANASMPRNAAGQRIYELGYDWQFRILMRDPQTGVEMLEPGMLQISMALPADENPVNYTQSSIRADRKGESQHVSFVFAETTGGRIALERKLHNVDRLFSDKGLTRFGSLEDGGFWSLLHSVPSARADATYKPWNRRLPLQRLYTLEAGKKHHRYVQPVAKNEDSGWTQSDVARITAKVDTLLRVLNLDAPGGAHRTEVDYLVRQFFGRPAAAEGQDVEVGNISPSVYEQAVELMLTNVAKHRVPTYGGIIPLPDETFMALVFEAQHGKAKPWAPMVKKGSLGRPAQLAKDWDQWAKAIFGQMAESNDEFHSMFRTDLDGFLHTWHGTNVDFMSMALSTDMARDIKLMDKESNEYLYSLDPNQELLLSEPILFDTSKATLDALVGYDPVVSSEFAREVPVSDLAKQIEHQKAWLSGKRLPKQKKAPMRSYLEEGVRYQESARDTHNFFHGMVNASIFARLLNPALWASAMIEVPVRNSMEHATNLMQGSTTGRVGRAIGKVGDAVGLSPRYTPEEQRKLDLLAERLGDSNEFLAEIYDSMTYHTLVEVGRGRIGHGLERAAGFSARVTSDPRFGMLAKSIGKRYLDAAMEYLAATDNTLTVDALYARMQNDPLYLKKQFSTERFSPHQAGLNRIAQVRSVKGTALSKLIMGPIDSMTRNPNLSVNATGHLLKIPFLFTRFNANALTTMLGLGGFDQLAAMMADGRRNPYLGRMKAAMLGVEYNPAEHDPIDMSDVLEGVDLMRPFIRGAMTQTGLMALGMMAGGLGLSGEDEEARRQRRLREYLGTPTYYDMREAQNAITYADAIFLDSVPVLGSIFKDATGRSAIMPHWIVRQFMSPVIGIERFFSTGDLRQIKWGYEEAFSAIPTSVTRLWSEASETADLLSQSAVETEGVGTPEAQAAVSQLLLNVVGVYEKALIESSFVNAIRNGADEYNRNPWVVPMVKDDGTIVTDKMGNAQPTDALQTFTNEEGELQQGYVRREAGGIEGALTHQYAENNATAAVLLSLFTGQWSGESTFLRDNMVPSTKIVELGAPSKAAAEALVLMAARGTGAAGPKLSLEEIERALKARDQAAGKWWDQAEISAEANKIFEIQGDKQAAMSLLDDEGREIITKAGADGIFRGLRLGTVELGDESLRGVYIPYEMRVEIEREWVAELIQEGVDLGLDQTAAKYRARRIWKGDNFDNPDGSYGGLRAILWSDKIPVNGKVKYNQLNTTYVLGPDGRPLATPFKRTDPLQAFGIPLPHGTHDGGEGGLTVDARGNIVDTTLGTIGPDGQVRSGINTGMAALERVDESWKIEPPDEKELEDLFAKNYTSSTTSDGSGSGGYRKGGYYRRGGYGGGGGGGGGGGYFSKMYSLPRNVAPYDNSTPFINTSNPILRRAFVRRERISSERGRLNQWQ